MTRGRKKKEKVGIVSKAHPAAREAAEKKAEVASAGRSVTPRERAPEVALEEMAWLLLAERFGLVDNGEPN